MDPLWLAILKEGGTLALAALALWMLNKVWDERLQEQKRNTETEKAQKQEYKELACKLSEVIEENTKVIAVFMERTQKKAGD